MILWAKDFCPTSQMVMSSTCHLSETLLFSAVAPIVADAQIGFIYRKNVECTLIEVYNAFTAILLDNINNFGERFGVFFTTRLTMVFL